MINPYDMIASDLVLLSTLQRHMADLHAAHTAAREALIPEDIRQALAACDAAHTAQQTDLAAEIERLTAQVKANVLSYGHSLKAGGLHAVYSTGRVSWDDAFLQGYAATHEEILQARREGQPSVSLRKA